MSTATARFADQAEALVKAAKDARRVGDFRQAELLAASARQNAKLCLSVAVLSSPDDADDLERAENAADAAEDVQQGGGRSERPWRVPPHPGRVSTASKVVAARQTLEKLHKMGQRHPRRSTGRRSW